MHFVVNNTGKPHKWIELVTERNHRRSTPKGIEYEIGRNKSHEDFTANPSDKLEKPRSVAWNPWSDGPLADQTIPLSVKL